MSPYRMPPGIGRLVVGALLISLSVLAAVIYGEHSTRSSSSSPALVQSRSPSVEDRNASDPPQIANDNNSDNDGVDSPDDNNNLDKRLFGMGGLPNIFPPALSKLKPGLLTSLVGEITNDINNLAPSIIPTNVVPPIGGLPLLTNLGPDLPLIAPPQPTAGQLGGLANLLGNVLSAAVPADQANNIIAGITAQAGAVISQAGAAATDVASLANAVAADAVAAPVALGNVETLLEGLDASINSVVQDVAAGGVVSALLPDAVVNDLANALRSGLEDVVAVASGGPVDLVGSLIESNVCGVVTPVDGVVQTVAGLCGAMQSAVDVAEETNPLLGPGGPLPVPTADPLAPLTGAAGSVTGALPSMTSAVGSGLSGIVPSLPTDTNLVAPGGGGGGGMGTPGATSGGGGSNITPAGGISPNVPGGGGGGGGVLPSNAPLNNPTVGAAPTQQPGSGGASPGSPGSPSSGSGSGSNPNVPGQPGGGAGAGPNGSNPPSGGAGAGPGAGGTSKTTSTGGSSCLDVFFLEGQWLTLSQLMERQP